MKVAIVAGGPSVEAEVSRTSARAVFEGLRESSHEPTVLELDRGLPSALAGTWDVVFPIVHGPLGEDGCLQGLLEILELPYVGSGVLASALAAEKPAAKVQFRDVGLPVAREVILERCSDLAAAARNARSALGRSVVVKPAAGGSGIGVSLIGEDDADEDLVAAVASAFEVGPRVLVERRVVGKEVTCGVLCDEGGVPVALPPTLILPQAAGWYDFESRYAAGGSRHECPAPFEPEVTRRIRAIAVAAHVAIGARDLSRADFVVGDGRDLDAVTLLELNTLPGFTATSLFPEAAAVAGVSFSTLCDRLVRLAVARPRADRRAALPMP